MLLHDYLNSGNYTASLVKTNVSNISNNEIQSIKKRIDFYVQHYKISTKKMSSESKKRQLDFLINLNFVLENEINQRMLAA